VYVYVQKNREAADCLELAIYVQSQRRAAEEEEWKEIKIIKRFRNKNWF
jgi:hypothetical protein